MHTPLNLIPARGYSMSPFLNGDHVADEPNDDDWVLVDVRNGVKSTLQRGMVIVYRSPHDPERWGVKRVIALQGDKITPKPGYPGGDEPLIVPWGHVWVEGDAENRDKSLDSNWFGPISRNLIVGRVTWVLWPWKHFAEVRWKDADLPDRLQMDAVQLENPDEVAVADVFRNGYAQGILTRLHDPTSGAAETAYGTNAGRRMLVGLLETSRAEIERQDPETAALAAALHKEVKLVLDSKGRMAQEIPPIDPPHRTETDPPDDTDTRAPVRAAYQKPILTAEEKGVVSERTPPTVPPKYNNALSAPYVDDTPKRLVS
jgi:signal peptidase I